MLGSRGGSYVGVSRFRKAPPLYIYENSPMGVAPPRRAAVVVRSLMRPAPRAFGFVSPCSIPAYRFARERMQSVVVVAPRPCARSRKNPKRALDIAGCRSHMRAWPNSNKGLRQ